ncbi:sodium:proton antiporter [Leptolyngbya sp. FACHB-261]|uniref:cation:proton antiporter n=1 Tax=Leptolyngbya sp. FACHB-261 TaxID=2692806 RepID=UPI001686D771|nr:sodium:proton antiporter [Leptolyngbya sp. FACHB-261]MBD2103473.1 cation:proton antiporter [Leptolyngbya sp. FACHB-261]
MDGSFVLTLLIVITVVAGISAQVLADFCRVPSIVFLLLFGVLLGPDGFDVVHPQLLGLGLEVVVSLSVALILFEGGLNLQLRELGWVSGSLQNLVTIGTLITLLGGGAAAHWLGEFPWPVAFLYASLVVVTGPTVINPILKQIGVGRRVKTLLEGEGVLIDPVGAILAVVVLDIVLNGDAEPRSIITGLGLRLGIGAGIGAIGGWLLAQILKYAKFLSDELKNLVVLAGLWGLFGLAQTLQSESGLMTAVAAGMAVQAAAVPEERLLRRFKGQLTTLAISILFILLAADLSIDSVFALGWGGVLTVLSLMLLVRPLNIWICTWDSGLNWRQKAFMAWVAPRGIVSASVSSVFSILLTERGINGGDAIKALVFLTIAMTVVLQGLTAKWVARWLRLDVSEARGAVIVGSHALGRLVAHLFQDRGESVVLLDTNPEYCRQAQAENLRVILSSGLDVAALEKAGLASVGTFVAITSNAEVNLMVAERAAEEFRPPRVLAAYPREETISKGASTTSEIAQAFLPQVHVKAWNQYLSTGEARLGETILREAEFENQQADLQAMTAAGELLPLLLLRSGNLQIVPADLAWEPSDRLIYLLHVPRLELVSSLQNPVVNGIEAVSGLPLGVPLPERVTKAP